MAGWRGGRGCIALCLVGICVALALALSPASADRAVPCRVVACVGVLGDAPFEVHVPAEWDGTLVLWLHGHQPLRSGTGERAVAAPSAEAVAGVLGRGWALARTA